ncbi:RNA polymerase sigma factor [Chitinophaga arvensicola]|uniref:Sigma-70 region 2 n=1 Tax=Chitinophaga arvensicola TaxID=29529 RepID=A0A1I0R3F8_9BACT|nr:sigma-70 family RNA polymerase sigma factor [Chitinophaga arvensicola]SEW34909.1 Sigma-70 region 2 [Chitinophaga arvensicola]
MNASLQDDIDLLHHIRQNDAGAFRELFDRYWQLLFQLASRKTGHAQDAEDMVQELFIELWRKKEPLILQVSLQSYLVSCIYLKIFQYFRKKGFQEKHYEDFARYEAQIKLSPEASDLTDLSFETEYGKLQDIITQTIALMPPQMQTVFSLKHYRGLTTNDIAAELNISSESVKTHLKLGMIRLRKAGEQYPAGVVLLPAFLTILESSY